MRERESVWVVEQCWGREYHIIGVYSTRENADVVVEAIQASGGEANRCEWGLNSGLDKAHAGLSVHGLSMTRTGDVDHLRTVGFQPETKSAFWVRGRLGMMSAVVWARDKDHAVKIVNEKRIQMIDSGEWPEGGEDAS